MQQPQPLDELGDYVDTHDFWLGLPPIRMRQPRLSDELDDYIDTYDFWPELPLILMHQTSQTTMLIVDTIFGPSFLILIVRQCSIPLSTLLFFMVRT
jgi:hypothetical protein